MYRGQGGGSSYRLHKLGGQANTGMNLSLPVGRFLWYFSMATEETIFRSTYPVNIKRKTKPASVRT